MSAQTVPNPPHLWQPGQSGNPNGKPKGALSRRTLDALRRMEAMDYDPLEELIEIARDPETTKSERARIAEALMAYSYPKLKPMEVATPATRQDMVKHEQDWKHAEAENMTTGEAAALRRLCAKVKLEAYMEEAAKRGLLQAGCEPVEAEAKAAEIAKREACAAQLIPLRG